MNEWINEDFYNPSGPCFLRLKINEDIRLKLLDSIKDHLATEWEDLPIIDVGPYDIQKNSVVDGKMGRISEEWQEKHSGNIIKNTIQSVLCRYGELYYNMPCISSIADVWYVVMKSGDFHALHSHHGLELSGAIYLEVPDNLPYPQGNMNWVMGEVQHPLYNNIYEHSPQPGDVFIWPGWLMHTVYPFRSKQERLMISFNGTAIRK